MKALRRFTVLLHRAVFCCYNMKLLPDSPTRRYRWRHRVNQSLQWVTFYDTWATWPV